MLRAPSAKSLQTAVQVSPQGRSCPAPDTRPTRRGSERLLRSSSRLAALTERVGMPEVLAMLVGICLLAGWAYVVTHSDALTQPAGEGKARASTLDSELDWPQATQETYPAHGTRVGGGLEAGEVSTVESAAGIGRAGAGLARGSRGGSAGAAAAVGAASEGLRSGGVGGERQGRSGRQGGRGPGDADEYGLQRDAALGGFRDMAKPQDSHGGREGSRVSDEWADEHGLQRGTGAAAAARGEAREADFALSAAAAAAAGAARTQARPQQVAMPKVGGRWASGLPYLDGAVKRADARAAGLWLELRQLHVEALKKAVLAEGEALWAPAVQARENAVIQGRQGALERAQPGAGEVLLAFCDQRGAAAFRLPWFARWAPLVQPLLAELLGEEDLPKLLRLALVRMPPGARISLHADRGGFLLYSHRIVVPVLHNSTRPVYAACPAAPYLAPGASLAAAAAAGCASPELSEGAAFEVNNAIPYMAVNEEAWTRIDLVMDVAEAPPARHTVLSAGAVCAYREQALVC